MDPMGYNDCLVGGFNPLKKWKSVGIILPNIWKNKSHVPNHQPAVTVACWDWWPMSLTVTCDSFFTIQQENWGVESNTSWQSHQYSRWSMNPKSAKCQCSHPTAHVHGFLQSLPSPSMCNIVYVYQKLSLWVPDFNCNLSTHWAEVCHCSSSLRSPAAFQHVESVHIPPIQTILGYPWKVNDPPHW